VVLIRTDGPLKNFKEDAVRLIVDRDPCEGNAVCMGIAPDIFELDDEDYAVVKTGPIPADREHLAEQAIAEHPRAIAQRLAPTSTGVAKNWRCS
jgi:ferredoxin